MKNLFKKLFVVVAVFGLLSCEPDRHFLDLSGFDGDFSNGWVHFEVSSRSVAEDDPEGTELVVLRSDIEGSETVTIELVATYVDDGTDATSTFTVTPSNLQVTFEAGQARAVVAIIPINNDIADGNKTLEFTITNSARGAWIGYPGEARVNSAATVTIIDDDCPIDINAFVGTFSVAEQFTSGPNAPRGLASFFGESYRLILTLDPTDVTGTRVIINNAPGFDEYIPDGTVMTFLTCSGTVMFGNNEPPLIAVFRFFQFTESSYDEAASTVVVSGPLATFGPYQFILTRISE
jgi:hypothetical protein